MKHVLLTLAICFIVVAILPVAAAAVVWDDATTDAKLRRRVRLLMRKYASY